MTDTISTRTLMSPHLDVTSTILMSGNGNGSGNGNRATAGTGTPSPSQARSASNTYTNNASTNSADATNISISGPIATAGTASSTTTTTSASTSTSTSTSDPFEPSLVSDYFFDNADDVSCAAMADLSLNSTQGSPTSQSWSSSGNSDVGTPLNISPAQDQRQGQQNFQTAPVSRVGVGGAREDWVGPFLLGPVLGAGCTGTVRLGTHKHTKFQVAFKIIDKKYLDTDPNLWRKVKREVVILKVVEHPHVLKLYDVLETKDKLYLVLEHVKGGELFDYIIQKGRLDRHESLKLTAQIVSGLEHCHAHNICHRDLKPENLLLDQNHNVKIADFGMAQLMKKDAMRKTSCGSPHYASPEIVVGGPYDARQSDVWSIGVILFVLITGCLPFDNENISTLLNMVARGQYHTPRCVPPDISDLISRMLQVDPKKRIQLSEIRNHPCYQGTNYFKHMPEPHCASITARRKSINFIQEQADGMSSATTATTSLSSSPTLGSSPSPSPSPSSRALARRSSSDDSWDIDERVLSDLESLGLGWGSREELREKIIAKPTDPEEEPSLEKVFYNRLMQRKIDRLQELAKLSPKSRTRTIRAAVTNPSSRSNSFSLASSGNGNGSLPSSPAPSSRSISITSPNPAPSAAPSTVPTSMRALASPAPSTPNSVTASLLTRPGSFSPILSSFAGAPQSSPPTAAAYRHLGLHSGGSGSNYTPPPLIQPNPYNPHLLPQQQLKHQQIQAQLLMLTQAQAQAHQAQIQSQYSQGQAAQNTQSAFVPFQPPFTSLPAAAVDATMSPWSGSSMSISPTPAGVGIGVAASGSGSGSGSGNSLTSAAAILAHPQSAFGSGSTSGSGSNSAISSSTAAPVKWSREQRADRRRQSSPIAGKEHSPRLAARRLNQQAAAAAAASSSSSSGSASAVDTLLQLPPTSSLSTENAVSPGTEKRRLTIPVIAASSDKNSSKIQLMGGAAPVFPAIQAIQNQHRSVVGGSGNAMEGTGSGSGTGTGTGEPVCVSVSCPNPNQAVPGTYYESPRFHRRKLHVQVPPPTFLSNGQAQQQQQQYQHGSEPTAAAMSIEPELGAGSGSASTSTHPSEEVRKSWFAGIFAQKPSLDVMRSGAAPAPVRHNPPLPVAATSGSGPGTVTIPVTVPAAVSSCPAGPSTSGMSCVYSSSTPAELAPELERAMQQQNIHYQHSQQGFFYLAEFHSHPPSPSSSSPSAFPSTRSSADVCSSHSHSHSHSHPDVNPITSPRRRITIKSAPATADTATSSSTSVPKDAAAVKQDLKPKPSTGATPSPSPSTSTSTSTTVKKEPVPEVDIGSTPLLSPQKSPPHSPSASVSPSPSPTSSPSPSPSPSSSPRSKTLPLPTPAPAPASSSNNASRPRAKSLVPGLSLPASGTSTSTGSATGANTGAGSSFASASVSVSSCGSVSHLPYPRKRASVTLPLPLHAPIQVSYMTLPFPPPSPSPRKQKQQGISPGSVSVCGLLSPRTPRREPRARFSFSTATTATNSPSTSASTSPAASANNSPITSPLQSPTAAAATSSKTRTQTQPQSQSQSQSQSQGPPSHPLPHLQLPPAAAMNPSMAMSRKQQELQRAGHWVVRTDVPSNSSSSFSCGSSSSRTHTRSSSSTSPCSSPTAASASGSTPCTCGVVLFVVWIAPVPHAPELRGIHFQQRHGDQAIYTNLIRNIQRQITH